MVARVTRYRIRPGKIEEFTTILQSLTAAMDELKGFRVLLILQGEKDESHDATAISVWDSAEAMKDSDSNTLYYHILSRLLRCCESFSPMHQQQVLLSKFGKGSLQSE